MAYGFVAGFTTAVLFTIVAPWASFVVPSTAVFALIGTFGGLFPDIDQLEFWGPPCIRKYFTHKKTLHYLLGYFILGTLLFIIALENRQNSFWFLALACGSIGAGVHSFMDPFDGWRDDNPKQGIYEHLTRRWLPSLQLVVFAHMWEWVIQAFATIWFIAISAHLSQLFQPGWQVATEAYFAIWIVSALFDVHIRASDRQARELKLLAIKKEAKALTVSQSITTPPDVDCTTLDKKLMMGYQGWFGCTGDGSEADWWHWSLDGSIPDPSNLSVDMWPDTSDLSKDDLFETKLSNSSGPASLYSAYSSSVVDLHFKWMQKFQLDGVMLQRFVSELGNENAKRFRDKVISNVKSSAKTYGRAFCIMYDITGSTEDTFAQALKDDWRSLVDDGITESPPYLKHNGKPVLAIWGLGFTDRPGTAKQANDIITYFQTGALPKYQVTLLGGVPTCWRTPGVSGGDSKPDDPIIQPSDPTWLKVYTSFDVLSPWSVNRYSMNSSPTKMGADEFLRNIILMDKKFLDGLSGQNKKIDYMPVVFPGYSTKNQGRKDPNRILNEVPRLGGRFWWRQVYNAVDIAKCNMIYGAMFDEVNEGTAIYKLVADQKDLPQQAELVPLNVPGESPGNLQNDHYLWLAGETNSRLGNENKFTQNMPTRVELTPQPNWFSRVIPWLKPH